MTNPQSIAPATPGASTTPSTHSHAMSAKMGMFGKRGKHGRTAHANGGGGAAAAAAPTDQQEPRAHPINPKAVAFADVAQDDRAPGGARDTAAESGTTAAAPHAADRAPGTATDASSKEGQQQQQVEQKEGDDQPGLFLDEEALLAASSFAIPPGELIHLAKDVLRKGVHKCGKLAADFTFTAPFVGPLSSEDFASVMERLALEEVFPDMAPRIHHMRVDPLQPNRVWFTNRPVGTHKGYLHAGLPIPLAPTGKVVELPPQTSSLSFNANGEVTDFTMGYVMDRRLGNTRGLGGAFGFLWALGVPFPYPEGRPWSSSWQQRLFNTGNPLVQAAMFVLDRLSSALLPRWMVTSHSRNMP